MENSKIIDESNQGSKIFYLLISIVLVILIVFCVSYIIK